VCLWVGDKMSA